MKASTALRNKMLDTSAFRTFMNLGFIKIYGGAVPADADAALGGATLICTISNNSTGTGLTMAASAAAGVLSKTVAEVWSGVNGTSATATFYRHVAPGDTGALSTTEPRIQGTIGTAGADMNLTSTALVNGATQTVDFYTVTFPTL